MPRSPSGATRLSSYEEAWEAINRLIRNGGSWSGFERNCFFWNAGGGRFVNASGASGLDFIEDGRAFAVVDLEGDGDPDLVLKNRSSPQVRVLRNDLPRRPGRVSFLLEGKRANRDAVGARLVAQAGGARRVRSLKCGEGFLSQSSRWLSFAFPGAARLDRLEIHWPGSATQVIEGLALDARHRIREGEAPRSTPFHAASEPPASATIRAEPEPPPRGVWLLAGLDLPSLFPAAGSARERVVALFSPACPRCRGELRDWEAAVERLRQAGVGVDLVQAEESEEAGVSARSLAARHPETFRWTLADATALRAFAVLAHQALRLGEELAVPLSFLVDTQGQAVRIQRGAWPAVEIVRDVALLRTARDPFRLGLPFPGRFYTGEPHRDHFQAGLGAIEAGLGALARQSFERAIRERPEDAEALFNLGAIRADLGGLAPTAPTAEDIEAARALFERAARVDPQFVDAHSNLGVLLARGGDFAGAEAAFLRALALRPGHVEALLNLGSVREEAGRPEEALRAFEDAARAESGFSAPWRKIGELHRRNGRLDAAIRSFRKAVELDDTDPELRSNLAVTLAEAGLLTEAAAELREAVRTRPGHAPALNNLGLVERRLNQEEKARESFRAAIAADPQLAEPFLNLARSLLSGGRRAEARDVLQQLLARQPGHAPALELLRAAKE